MTVKNQSRPSQSGPGNDRPVSPPDQLADAESPAAATARSTRSLAVVLPIFVFLATLLGSLIGAAADLNESKEVLVDVLNRLNPPPTLRIAGSNTLLGEEITLAADWQRGFEEQETWLVGEKLFGQEGIPLLGQLKRTVDVQINGIGTAEACQQAVTGEPIDLLVASEPIPCYDELVAHGIEVECMGVIGYDVIAFVTQISNSGGEIEKREITSILQGTIDNWSQVRREVGPIRILARQGSGTTDIVLERLTDKYGAGDFPDHFTTCETNEDCLDKALNIPGSLYWVSTAWLRTQPPRYLRLILIKPDELGRAAEDPLKEIRGEEKFEPDNYTPELIRPLYMYVLKSSQSSPASTELARQFLSYVRGIQGQEILENHHFYTHFDQPANIQPEFLPGFGLNQDGSPLICRQQ